MIQVFRQGMLAWSIGYVLVLVGILFIWIPVFMTNFFGAFFIVVGYQVTLWATGIQGAIFGNKPDVEIVNDSETPLSRI